MTVNVDVTDGLVNGAQAHGKIVHIVYNTTNEVVTIFICFNDPVVGVNAIHRSIYRHVYATAVSIQRHKVTFFMNGKQGAEITRLQFPLTLCWATAIHKVQGLTLDQIVVDLSIYIMRKQDKFEWITYLTL